MCPLLVKTFDMSIWQPTCEKTLDVLPDAEVDVYVSLSFIIMGMSLTPCSARLRYSEKEAFVKKIPLLNKKIVHFVDNVSWDMDGDPGRKGYT